MPSIERTETAKALLSFMLAISVGFWASELADFVEHLDKEQAWEIPAFCKFPWRGKL